MFLRGSVLGLILFNTFIDALDGGTECALKHDDTQLGGANDVLEDRTTIQRGLDRVGVGLAGLQGVQPKQMPSPAAGTQPPQEAGQTGVNRLERSFAEEMRILVYKLCTGEATSGCCAQHWAA